MSFTVTKSISPESMPIKGSATVTLTVNMVNELVNNPRDIVIAWDNFSQDNPKGYNFDMNDAIRTALTALTGLTGGTEGNLGSGSRVMLYGSKGAAEAPVLTTLGSSTAPIIAALDELKATPVSGFPISVDPIVQALAGATGRKTVLICNLTTATTQDTAALAKLEAAGIEIFTLDPTRDKGVTPWGGIDNASSDGAGAAMLMAGLPQALLLEDMVTNEQFATDGPVTQTLGEARIKLPVLGKPHYRLYWELGLPKAVTEPQIYTATYGLVNNGPELGQLPLSTTIGALEDVHGYHLGTPITLANPDLTVNSIAEVVPDPDPTPGGGTDPDPTPGGGGTDPDPTPGGGTDPDPTPGGGTDPDPTPGSGGTDPDPTPGGGGTDPDPTPGGGTDPDPAPTGGEVPAEPCPTPTALVADHCKDAVHTTVPEVLLQSLGRVVQVDVVIKNVCPGKRVAATVLLTELDAQGMEQTRGMKHILVPAQTGTECADVTLKCVQFSVPEALDLSGSVNSICNARNFQTRVIANYVDSDFVCCDSGMTTL